MVSEKVSILIPFKNTEKYLEDCLNSILNQTYKNWQAILVDDNSIDKSLNIVKDFSKSDSRIIVLKNNGNGIIEALKTAYKKADGEFITRMDSDDLMTTNKIKCMASDLKFKGPGHIALGLVHYFSESGIKEGYKRYQDWLNSLISKGTSFNDIYKECVIPSPCWMLYRSDFDKTNGFNSSTYPEDYDLAFRFYENGFRCIPSNKVLHLWRDYPLRTSRTSVNYKENSFLKLKIDYFLKLSYNPLKTLVLWGAGKKGKKTASLLISAKTPFVWICNNPNKIGVKIYDVILKPWQKLNTISNYQSIITIANENSQTTIKAYFESRKMKNMIDYFFFC